MGHPKLMRIMASNCDFTQVMLKPKPYKVMLNPEKVQHNRSVTYTKNQAQASTGPSQKYKGTPAEKLNFDLVIDCTGVVDPKRMDMETEMEALKKVIFTYDGKIHQPNFIMLGWGDFSFNGLLEKFDTTYTLFAASGKPLRAKVSLGFTEYITVQNRIKNDKSESPDISHEVVVVEGETLPKLCDRVWDSPSKYIQVARYNQLNKFRRLPGGRKLIFPPIIQPTP